MVNLTAPRQRAGPSEGHNVFARPRESHHNPQKKFCGFFFARRTGHGQRAGHFTISATRRVRSVDVHARPHTIGSRHKVGELTPLTVNSVPCVPQSKNLVTVCKTCTQPSFLHTDPVRLQNSSC